jgi:predicted N-acetyltransferase YhbS
MVSPPAEVVIRRATPAEADLLSALAQRSKAHWGYSAEFMEACRPELRYEAPRIAANPVFVAETVAGVAGFYSIQPLSPSTVELDGLFVEPASIGKGLGRRLVEHARQTAVAAGATIMIIQGDPNAAPFYLAMGATPAGQCESQSIPGRLLPMFQIDLASG